MRPPVVGDTHRWGGGNSFTRLNLQTDSLFGKWHTAPAAAGAQAAAPPHRPRPADGRPAANSAPGPTRPAGARRGRGASGAAGGNHLTPRPPPFAAGGARVGRGGRWSPCPAFSFSQRVGP